MVTNGIKPSIAIVGGTGKEGKGLAFRWAQAGYTVTVGSRNIEKAEVAKNELNRILHRNAVCADTNDSAVEKAEVIVITVPYSAHRNILETLKERLQGKVIIDVTVPLVPPAVTKVQMPSEGSAAQEAQKILGPECRVVSAFQNISHDLLMNNDEIQCDVFVCGTDNEARLIGLNLAKDAGLTGWDAGPIENSVVVEGLTSILIGLNKQYGSKSSGIKITGINRNISE